MDDVTTDPRTRRTVMDGTAAVQSGAYVRQRAAEIAISAQQRARLTDDPVLQSDLREIRRLAMLLVGIGNLASTLPAAATPRMGWIARLGAVWAIVVG